MNIQGQNQTRLTTGVNVNLPNKTRAALGSVRDVNQAQNTVEKSLKKEAATAEREHDQVDGCTGGNAFAHEKVFDIEPHEKYAENVIKCMASVCWPFKWANADAHTFAEDNFEKSLLFKSWESSNSSSQNMSPLGSPRATSDDDDHFWD